MPLTKLGKYERVDVLGHGATGIVYLAWDTLLKKQVALKEIDLHAADLNRFLEEARVMDRLHHPGIVRVNNVEVIDGQVVMDMEYIKGRNLQQLMRKEGKLPAGRAIELAIQTLDALDYAHRMRTVHRDIKPANILVDKDDHVKLVDFGLAEILATNSYAGGAGTYAYMAPEDFAEEHRSDHQSDIWAVGITLYEMLTAARPFYVDKPKDPFAWRRALMNEHPTPLSEHMDEVPGGLQSVIDRALAVDKVHRYASAAEFRDDLIAIRDGRQIDAALERTQTLPNSDRTQTLPLPDRNGLPTTAPIPPVYPPIRAEHLDLRQPPQAPAQPELPHAPRRALFKRREALPAVVEFDPPSIYFGELRKGDERSAKVHVRIRNGEGAQGGSVASAPGWASVSPLRFDRRKQTLVVTAKSGEVWQTGDFQDTLRLQTSGGPLEIPLALRVLPSRPRFSEIAAWFVPTFLAVLLPALSIAVLGRFDETRYLIPAAALGSGLLSLMLLQVCAAADIGVEERIATGLVFLMMCVILGVVIGSAHRINAMDSLLPLFGTGVPFGVMTFLQLFTRRYWKAWAGAIVILSILAAGTFVAAITSH